jgi:hypothetical protein
MQAKLVFLCSGENGDYFKFCSCTFVKHAQFHMHRNAKAVYMDFCHVLHVAYLGGGRDLIGKPLNGHACGDDADHA